MRDDKSANAVLDGLTNKKDLRVERKFASERRSRDMLQSLIRAHVGPG
jgi:hypothetical protein